MMQRDSVRFGSYMIIVEPIDADDTDSEYDQYVFGHVRVRGNGQMFISPSSMSRIPEANDREWQQLFFARTSFSTNDGFTLQLSDTRTYFQFCKERSGESVRWELMFYTRQSRKPDVEKRILYTSKELNDLLTFVAEQWGVHTARMRPIPISLEEAVC